MAVQIHVPYLMCLCVQTARDLSVDSEEMLPPDVKILRINAPNLISAISRPASWILRAYFKGRGGKQ